MCTFLGTVTPSVNTKVGKGLTHTLNIKDWQTGGKNRGGLYVCKSTISVTFDGRPNCPLQIARTLQEFAIEGRFGLMDGD